MRLLSTHGTQFHHHHPELDKQNRMDGWMDLFPLIVFIILMFIKYSIFWFGHNQSHWPDEHELISK